jgi:hypothetical protein
MDDITGKKVVLPKTEIDKVFIKEALIAPINRTYRIQFNVTGIVANNPVFNFNLPPLPYPVNIVKKLRGIFVRQDTAAAGQPIEAMACKVNLIPPNDPMTRLTVGFIGPSPAGTVNAAVGNTILFFSGPQFNGGSGEWQDVYDLYIDPVGNRMVVEFTASTTSIVATDIINCYIDILMEHGSKTFPRI